MRKVNAGVCGPYMGWHMLALSGIDIIGKIFSKPSNGHEFILVSIDYFTKWVEVASYVRLASSGIASFIRSHIIGRYGVPHELISDIGVYFRVEEPHSTLWCMADWAQARLDQLNLLNERRLRATDYGHAYQRKMTRAFKKRVKPRPLQRGDLVLKVIKGLIRDLRGKFRPNWSGPYFIRELTL
ncbi:hypothetical protein CK203_097563 [Vitis vinifera]|uniref:Integrase catalytic domain-containing protein n=1 Tax=Vitis vinifera TaxID=29760 RepID=A0A438E7B4_VITVI|nr:hypothetical protein CK203_097563 [Vitis vinifera]